MNKLAAVLRNARMQKDLSLRDIEKLCDKEISAQYVDLIESGATPSPKKLRVMARVYKLDFLELMILAGHVDASDLGGAPKKSTRGGA